MNIGIITYSNYDERVLMDHHFVIDNLFYIVQNDVSYRAFKIEDNKGKIVLSTDYRDTQQGAGYLNLPIIKKDMELIGTVYNAYMTPSTKCKYKTKWTVNSGVCKNKKHTHGYADMLKKRARLLLEKYIERI